MRSWFLASLAGTTAVLTAGCGVQGKWELARVEPVEGREQVEFCAFTLQDDGTFVAETLAPQAGAAESGTYTYSDGVLTLVGDDGQRQTYAAELSGGGEKMTIAPVQRDGPLVRATFVRGQ